MCFSICIESAAHSVSCMLCFVSMWSCDGLELVSVPPSFCPVLSVSLFLLCCVFKCGVMGRRVISHLNCVGGAFAGMYAVLCLHVVSRRPAVGKCLCLWSCCVVCTSVVWCAFPCALCPRHIRRHVCSALCACVPGTAFST